MVELSQRTESERLLNTPIKITVGGIGTSEAKTIELREPPNAEFQEHLRIIGEGVHDLVVQNAEYISAVWNGEPYSEMKRRNIAPKLDQFQDCFRRLVAHLVAEDIDYVNNEMSPRQTIQVLATYLELIGYEVIHSYFSQALERLTATRPVGTEPRKPPFAEQSS